MWWGNKDTNRRRYKKRRRKSECSSSSKKVAFHCNSKRCWQFQFGTSLLSTSNSIISLAQIFSFRRNFTSHTYTWTEAKDFFMTYIHNRWCSMFTCIFGLIPFFVTSIYSMRIINALCINDMEKVEHSYCVRGDSKIKRI